jgi:carbamoyl-phosphate synthase small subunit
MSASHSRGAAGKGGERAARSTVQRGTGKRRERSILPPAAAGEAEAGLRPAQASPTGDASGCLVLEDGSVFTGRSVGAAGVAFGEAVFTTGMTGYQEVVTDPSFAEQLVCFTAPMVGNYGVADDRDESPAVAARAVLMRRAGGEEWCRWLEERGVVALEGIDTRSLVLRLRSTGSMRAAAASGGVEPDDLLADVLGQPRMEGRALVAAVSTREELRVGSGEVHVGVVDYGCKRSIVRRLVAAGASITIFPHDVEAEHVLSRRVDGVVLSNGPGDPAALPAEVGVVRDLLGGVPLLGICLGHQLLGIALGYETYKLPFGHRGANHPVLDVETHRVLVTCQNHGFAVDGDGPEVTHRSLYDETVEGLAVPGERARSLQFHPEAGPGPHDAWPLLEAWVAELRGGGRAKAA